MKKLILMTILLLFSSTSVYAALAFVANVDGNWDLFVVGEDGKGLSRLTKTLYDEKDPSWSSDRREIVYATSDGQLNIIDVKTKKHLQIAVDDQGTPKLSPCFAPDDKLILYAQFIPGGKDDTDLKIYNRETKKSKRVLDQYAAQFWPAWSPDVSRMVYINNHCAGDCGRLIQELWIADPSGGYAQQLLMTNSLCQQPAWSPDGGRIAFSSDKSGNYDLWVLSLENWKLEQITTDESLDVSPAWSLEGNRLAFISTRSGRMEIWVKNLKSGEMRRLRPFGEKGVECKDVAWY